MVDWQDFAEKWAFKGKFFKKEFLASQMQFVSTNQLSSEKDQQNNESVCETTKDVDTLRESVRQQYKYESSWLDDDEKRCVICNKDIRVKGRLVPPKTISIVDKTEPTLKEFSEIHIKNNNLKYVEGAKRILLTLSTKSLLAANVAYHQKECFKPSRSPAWKRGKMLLVKLI